MGKRYVTTGEYLAMLRRMVRSAGTRVGRCDPSDLATLGAIQHDLDAAMVEAVRGLREDGFSWESIGSALGVTRQAALMRFGPKL